MNVKEWGSFSECGSSCFSPFVIIGKSKGTSNSVCTRVCCSDLLSIWISDNAVIICICEFHTFSKSNYRSISCCLLINTWQYCWKFSMNGFEKFTEYPKEHRQSMVQFWTWDTLIIIRCVSTVIPGSLEHEKSNNTRVFCTQTAGQFLLPTSAHWWNIFPAVRCRMWVRRNPEGAPLLDSGPDGLNIGKFSFIQFGHCPLLQQCTK